MSCFHDFVLIQMAPSVGLSFTEDLSDFFKFIDALPKFSHALILS